MKTKKPLIGKNTDRLLRSIIPQDFKLVKDKESNGYKLVNLLFGIEVDACRERLQDIYNNSFLNTIDLSQTSELYDVNLSYIPDEAAYLNSGLIKITDEYEFYNGDPTRLSPQTSVSLSGIGSGILGLEYFRQSERGSGYLIISKDTESKVAYLASSYATWKVYLDPLGEIKSYSGIYPGIEIQDYSTISRDEILFPISSQQLQQDYPVQRTILDENGQPHQIDWYEPYHGWTYDANSGIIPVVDYDGLYYFDANGDKIFYKTALNNPYGSGNYTTAYLNLEHIPISGTLQLFDIDILDISGNAVEIPQASSHKSLYRLQYSGWNIGTNSGTFVPTYEGYDVFVPSGKGFGPMEGKEATLLQNISWDYLYDGSSFNQDTRQFDEVSTGDLTNIIKINNPRSRYLVTYKYEVFKKLKYISSLEKSRYLSLDNLNPAYSVDTLLNNLVEVDYNFTNDPQYSDNEVITFDGIDVRPGSTISHIDFNIPSIVKPITSLNNQVSININQGYIGYSNDYIPRINKIKYELKHLCLFQSPIVGPGDINESGYFTYTQTSPNTLSLVSYDGYYAKRIYYDPAMTADSYYRYNKPGTNFEFCTDITYMRVKFILSEAQNATIIDSADSNKEDKLVFTISNNGLMQIMVNGATYGFSNKFNFSTNPIEFIIRKTQIYNTTTDYADVQLYIKTNSFFTKCDRWIRQETKATISSSYLYLFKNCRVTANLFKMWNEAY